MIQGAISPIIFYPILFFNEPEIPRVTDVNFIVPGKPQGKERPRTVRQGGFVRTYTPKRTADYEEKVRQSYHNYNGNIKLENAIEANIEGIFPVPKSTSKKIKAQMLNGDIEYTKKIDCDNLAKVILDALNNVAYNDDSQVCRLFVEKRYGEDPMVKVNLREVRK